MRETHKPQLLAVVRKAPAVCPTAHKCLKFWAEVPLSYPIQGLTGQEAGRVR